MTYSARPHNVVAKQATAINRFARNEPALAGSLRADNSAGDRAGEQTVHHPAAPIGPLTATYLDPGDLRDREVCCPEMASVERHAVVSHGNDSACRAVAAALRCCREPDPFTDGDGNSQLRASARRRNRRDGERKRYDEV